MVQDGLLIESGLSNGAILNVTNGGVKSAQTPPCDILFFFRLPRIFRKSSDTDTV